MDLREQIQAEAAALAAALSQKFEQATEARVQAAVGETARGLNETIEENARTIEANERELDDLRAALDQARAECTRLQVQIESGAADADQQLERLSAEAALSARAAEEARAALELAVSEAGTLRTDLQAAKEEAKAAESLMEQAQAALDEAEDAHTRTQAASQRAAVAPLDLLLGAMKRFAVAKNSGEMLAGFADSLAQDLGRAALFHVKGTRLEGIRGVGVAFASEISKLVVPLGMDSMLSDAVSSGRVQGLLGPGMTARTRALFGGTPSFAVVVPVVVKGEPLALLYADDAERENESVTPEQRMRVAELLLCQVLARLPGLARVEKTVAEHAEYANQLLARIAERYADERAADEAAMQKHLDEARDIYTQAAGDSEPAQTIFDEQVAQVAKKQGESPLGRVMSAFTKRAKGSAVTALGLGATARA